MLEHYQFSIDNHAELAYVAIGTLIVTQNQSNTTIVPRFTIHAIAKTLFHMTYFANIRSRKYHMTKLQT